MYIVCLSFLLVGSLVCVWPAKQSFTVETSYLLLAAVSGALGSHIHLASSFAEYAGRRALHASWFWWYLLRPVVGSSLALIVYFVVRAGLVTGSTDQAVEAINPHGVAALAALSGLFSKQASEKLRDVFENICAVKKTE